MLNYVDPQLIVSTHSRPKAAGLFFRLKFTGILSFNTQPPEGGWMGRRRRQSKQQGFNTQPPEGGWDYSGNKRAIRQRFQHTAARRRLGRQALLLLACLQFQHTAARRRLGGKSLSSSSSAVCFNTQPPEGGWHHPPSLRFDV